MFKKLFSLIGLVLILVISVILIKTFTVKTKQPIVSAVRKLSANNNAISHLQEAIRFKTVSISDSLPADTATFLAYQRFLANTYPIAFSKLQLQRINGLGLLFVWRGKDTTLAPGLILAHQDVVPVEPGTEKLWETPPFEGTIKNGFIYGRGVVDDKGSMIACLEALEGLLQQGIQPKRTILFGFGHDEEVGGVKGGKSIAEFLALKGVKLEFVLDEGGIITSKKVPGLEGHPVAVVGTAEKGYLSLQLSVNIKGGHSSIPEKETAIDVLAGAITKLHQAPFNVALSKASVEFFNYLAPEMPFINKMAFSNMWLFKGLVLKALGKSNEGKAMTMTTIAPTIFNSGVKDNVIPTRADAVVNFRILPGTTSKDVIAHVKKAINDERVVIKTTSVVFEPTPVTPANDPSFQMLMTSIKETFPNTIVTPYLCLGATDSRYFSSISKATMRFVPFNDIEGFHGVNEKIKVSEFKGAISFYQIFLSNL